MVFFPEGKLGKLRVQVRKQVDTSLCEAEDTPKYVAHVLGGAVSKKYRRLPRTEVTDIFE